MNLIKMTRRKYRVKTNFNGGNMHKTSILIFVALVFVSAHAKAEAYRVCMKSKMVAMFKAKPCKFDQVNASKAAAESACAQAMFDDLMADKTLKVGSPESMQAMNNKKKLAAADIQELITAEQKRCGATRK